MSQPAGNEPDPTQATPPTEPTGTVGTEPTAPAEAFDFFVTFYDAIDVQRTVHKDGATRADADTYLNAYMALVVPSADKTAPIKSMGQTIHFPSTDFPAMHAASGAATMVLELERPSDGKKARLTVHSASVAYRNAGKNTVNVADAAIVALAEAYNDTDGLGGYVPQPTSHYEFK